MARDKGWPYDTDEQKSPPWICSVKIELTGFAEALLPGLERVAD
jgi:hypothetical protein